MSNELIDAGTGATGGAIAGAEVGGPWGALAGGIIGGGLGLLEGSEGSSDAPDPSISAIFARVLPVMTSIKVVLPAPLGPITHRNSPTSIVKDNLLIA